MLDIFSYKMWSDCASLIFCEMSATASIAIWLIAQSITVRNTRLFVFTTIK
jgi:hypothetical protein